MTEWISGVNIPACQLMIGMGVPLHRIPDIRRLLGQDPRGTSPIDFDNDPQIPPSGARTRTALPQQRNASCAGHSRKHASYCATWQPERAAAGEGLGKRDIASSQ